MTTFQKENSKVIKISLRNGETLLARRGAMLMYTGKVDFAPIGNLIGGGGHTGGGIMGGVARHAQGEAQSLMSATGEGEIFYGFAGLHVHHIQLSGSPLTVESDRLLVYDSTLQTSTTFLGSDGGVKGIVRGAVTGQGLFTTQMNGVGNVVILSHGPVLELPFSPQEPIIIDPQSYLGHTGQAQARIQMKAGWRDAIGKGSGEALQLRLEGSGIGLVQASETKL